jgi:alpha-beta hydrolase superfamily lysophospholipase
MSSRAATLVVVAALGAALGAACAKPYLPARVEAPPLPPAPAGVAHTTWTFAGDGGVTLFARAWRPAEGEPRGVLVVMHGLRDHGGRYAGVAERATRRGYAVYAFDLRGHGRSAGRRVTIDGFDQYVADLDTFVTAVRGKEPGRPVFVLGHSMGGAIVTLWAVTRQPDVAGVITSAPALRLDLPPVAAAGTLLSATLVPNLGALAPTNDDFSTDPAVEAEMGKDPLIYQPGGPVATAAGLVGAIERIWAGVDRLTVPLLLLHGTADKLTAPAGSRELYQRAASTDKTLRLYDGLAHDLVHEPGQEQVVGDVLAWMDAHTGGPATAFAEPDLTRPLRGDGRKPSASVALEAGYRRGEGDTGGHAGGGGLRARALLGRRLAWPLALEAEAWGGDAFSWRVDAYPVGLALVRPGGHTLSLAAGGGLSDAGAGGTGFDVSLAVDAEVQLGPARLLAWGRVAWIFDEDVRRDGSDAPLGDELRLGVAVRLGRNHRLWSTVNAGTGPYLGVTLDQELGGTVLGVVLGLHLWGGS